MRAHPPRPALPYRGGSKRHGGQDRRRFRMRARGAPRPLLVSPWHQRLRVGRSASTRNSPSIPALRAGSLAGWLAPRPPSLSTQHRQSSCRPHASTRNSPSIPALRAGSLAGWLAPRPPSLSTQHRQSSCRPHASTRNSPSIPALRAGALAGWLAPRPPSLSTQHHQSSRRPHASTRNSPSIPALRAGALAGWLAPLLPFERALFPLVDESDDQDREKNHHRPETEYSDVGEHDRPREEKRDLQVEQDEQDRDQVIANVELHACVFEGLETAFVGRELLGVGAVRRQHRTDRKENETDNDAHD